MQYAWLNGTWVSSDNPSIPSQDVGNGLFETVCVHHGSLRLWDRHWNRMTRSAADLSMHLDRDSKSILRAARELVKKNGLREGAIKIIHHQKSGTHDWAIITREQFYSAEQYRRGFRVRVHPTPRQPDSNKYGHKRINHTEPRIARKEAAALGFDETLFLNERGQLCEGSYSNLFFVKNSELFTPALDCGLLPGVARGEVICWAKERGIAIHEGYYSLETLWEADEAFVTNALAGAMPVHSIEADNGEECYKIEFDLNRAFVTMELANHFA